MKITDADRVLLNPEYIKQLEQEEEQKEQDKQNQLPEDMKEYVDDVMSDPLRTSDNPLVQYVVDYLEHPEDSQIYRDEVIFKTEADKGIPKEDEPPEKGFSIFIPIFSAKF